MRLVPVVAGAGHHSDRFPRSGAARTAKAGQARDPQPDGTVTQRLFTRIGGVVEYVRPADTDFTAPFIATNHGEIVGTTAGFTVVTDGTAWRVYVLYKTQEATVPGRVSTWCRRRSPTVPSAGGRRLDYRERGRVRGPSGRPVRNAAVATTRSRISSAPSW